METSLPNSVGRAGKQRYAGCCAAPGWKRLTPTSVGNGTATSAPSSCAPVLGLRAQQFGVNGFDQIFKFIQPLIAIAVDKQRRGAIHPAAHSAQEVFFDRR